MFCHAEIFSVSHQKGFDFGRGILKKFQDDNSMLLLSP